MAARKKRKKKYRMFWFFAKMQLVLLLAVIAGACWYYFGGYAEEVKDLKTQAIELVRHSSKETFKANQTSIVYALDESVISTLKGGKDSYYLSITDMPSNVECAIVSIEDKKFFRHNGIDYRALLRAVKAMIENGEATQGGSTITMQLARNIFLSQEKTWQRKVEECISRGNSKRSTPKMRFLNSILIIFILETDTMGSSRQAVGILTGMCRILICRSRHFCVRYQIIRRSMIHLRISRTHTREETVF